MKINATSTGAATLLELEGRQYRESAEHLSDSIRDLIRDGVRSLSHLDVAGVTYVSSAAAEVLVRWHEELAVLRGELQLTAFVSAWSPHRHSSTWLYNWNIDLRIIRHNR